jgi:CHAT domain-containing protein
LPGQQVLHSAVAMRVGPALTGILLIASIGVTPAVQPSTESGRTDAVRSLIVQGHYDEAETAAFSLLSIVRERFGDDAIETEDASDVLTEALWRNGRWTPSTQSIAERVVAAKEARLGPNDSILLPSVRNLGEVLLRAGNSKGAIAQFERSLALQHAAGGANPAEIGDALDSLARARLQDGRYDEALETIAQSLQLKQLALASDDIRVARTLEIQSQIFLLRGEYPQARPPLERALAIRERAQPTHPEMAAALALKGDLLWFEGNVAEARAAGRRSLALAERTIRADHPDIAVFCRKLASPLAALGEFAAALELRKRAVAIAEEVFGPESLSLGGYLNDLANSYGLQGEHSAARSLFERALTIYERGQGSLNGTATFAHNLAEVSAALGDVPLAMKHQRRAIALWRQAFGPQHPFVATGVSNLADMLMAQGKSMEASPLYEQVLAMRERSLGPDHRDVARALADLATARSFSGRMDTAEILSARAVQIWERANSNNSPDFARALSVRGDVRSALGDYSGARQHHERSLELLTRVLGPSHPSVAEARLKFGAVLGLTRDYRAAFAEAIEAERTGRDHLRLTLRYLPEREALTYAARRPKGLDLALSMIVQGDRSADAPDVALDSLLKARGVVLDEMAARHRAVLNQGDSELAPLVVTLASARQRVANLTVRDSLERPALYRSIMDEALLQKNQAERALAEKSATFRAELAQNNAGLPEVRAALPVDSAVVSYVRYDRTTTSTSAARQQTVPSYMAFVLRSGASEVISVALGAASEIDNGVTSWRKNAASGVFRSSATAAERTYRASGNALRRQIWDPVAPYLQGADRVFVVPDGALNLLSFDTLPTGSSGYLTDTPPAIQYLSAERDLVSLRSGNAGTGLLAVGGPAFDEGPSHQPDVITAATFRGMSSTCASFHSLRFLPLPGTLREAADVARLWDAPVSSPPTLHLLTGAAANERSFKQQAPGHRVLHLATHGFFLGNSCQRANDGTRAVGGLTTTKPRKTDPVGEQNPLLLAGLALAGANRRATARPEDDDGILTAEEVAALNLDGVEWAVLSACDTGLGEIKAGEGVFGLRRAFQIAGARTVIMSLWSVEDESTRQWMRALYEGRLLRHLSTTDAVREANLTVLRNRRSKGLSTHPFYWGAFVAAGDWR